MWGGDECIYCVIAEFCVCKFLPTDDRRETKAPRFWITGFLALFIVPFNENQLTLEKQTHCSLIIYERETMNFHYVNR